MQMRQNTNVTKCKCDKMQIRQNAKIPNINNPKPPYSRPPPLMHWFSIGTPSILFLLYFGLFIYGIFAFCLICILSHLYFVTFALCLICILSYLHLVRFAFCFICILSYLHFVIFAICRFCILSDLHFVVFLHFVCLHFVWIPFLGLFSGPTLVCFSGKKVRILTYFFNLAGKVCI